MAQIFKTAPEWAGPQNSTVMASASMVSIDVVKLMVWSTHSKHIEAVLMMAVKEGELIFLWWRDFHITAIDHTSNWRKPKINFRAKTNILIQ